MYLLLRKRNLPTLGVIMPSNNLVINGLRVPIPKSVIDVGGTATNYLDDFVNNIGGKEPHLSNGKRVKPLVTFVLHETCGNSATGCKETLRKEGLGVHLILDKNGIISNHADLATEICWHANQCNSVSVGMEVVNAYRPEITRDPHGDIVPSEWWTWVPKGQPKTYVTPTKIQMDVARIFVPWLCGVLQIPITFPTISLNAKKSQISGWKKFPKGWSAKPGPGIVAHRDFSSHGDGRYMLEDIIESV